MIPTNSTACNKTKCSHKMIYLASETQSCVWVPHSLTIFSHLRKWKDFKAETNLGSFSRTLIVPKGRLDAKPTVLSKLMIWLFPSVEP